MPRDWFGTEVARTYDEDVAEMATPERIAATVSVLADLAGDARVLELGIGTGRVALPLAGRGISITGVDLSSAMVDQLRAKPGGADIPVVIGDFASTRLDGEFGLVFLVFNTIMNLTTQDEQVACFRSAAAHLTKGGYFVVEVNVPDLQRLPAGERFRPFHVSDEHVGIDEYDVVAQGLVSHHIRPGRVETPIRSIPFRYVWPAELDLMARLAGMRLVDRWADWDRSTFDETSQSHVSVWQKVSNEPW
jgi:SAM-dependent methyltransferase